MFFQRRLQKVILIFTDTIQCLVYPTSQFSPCQLQKGEKTHPVSLIAKVLVKGNWKRESEQSHLLIVSVRSRIWNRQLPQNHQKNTNSFNSYSIKNHLQTELAKNLCIILKCSNQKNSFSKVVFINNFPINVRTEQDQSR